MRPVILVLLLLALIALLVFLVVVLTDRFEEFGHHPQPTYYAALIQAGSAGGRVLGLGYPPISSLILPTPQ